MCENHEPIPEAVVEYAVKLANLELTGCDAYFPTPRGELRGKILLSHGQAVFVCTGSEADRAYALKCGVSVRMWTSTILHLPDGTVAGVTRKSRHQGDVEGTTPLDQMPKPGTDRSCLL